MAKNRVRFTTERLNKLEYDNSLGKKRQYIYDAEQPKLALQITPTGSKTFYLHCYDTTRKRSVVKKIGSYPETKITTAREDTVRLLDRINKGENIIAAARQIKEEDTFDQVFSRWMESAKQHKRSWTYDQMRYDKYIAKALGKKRISEIDRSMVRNWFHGLAKKNEISTTTANRILAIVKTVFSQELPDHPSPCKGIKMYHEYSRDRFLQPSELQRFFEALSAEETPEYLTDYILLSLFTGARKSNVMSMRWRDIDFQLNTWTIPGQDSKNKTTMTLPLIPETVEILQRRKITTSSIFVLPSPGRSKSKTGHMTDPRSSWKNLLKRAKLEDFRLHDLRRTLGSYQTIAGTSTAIVGRTLGHKSQAATAVYARLNLDPVRASMETAVEAMLATRDLPEKVVSIGGDK